MHDLVMFVLVLMLGMTIVIIGSAPTIHELKELKISAINYGYATYTVDVNGTSSFTWIIPAEKK
jgi:uncharacterized membrane protein